MKVPNSSVTRLFSGLSLSRLQNEGSQLPSPLSVMVIKSIKATE